jgi:3-oxoacyl-[acyl-carrier protein] reductase
MTSDLTGRVALVTGVSRAIGIGVAVAERLHDMGATVFATGWSPHDVEMPWGVGQTVSLPSIDLAQHDLAEPGVATALVDEVVERHGRLDIVIAVHARSSEGGLSEVTEVELDRCWAANVRSVVMLAQRFAQVHEPPPADRAPIGRMVWFTSGQALSPMDGELAYAVSKGALHQLTGSLAHALVPARIVANCINPGPVDTGYAPPEVVEAVQRRFPDGRWGQPADVANLIAFLVSDQGAWIRGQVLDSEGGFDRH